MRLLLIGDDSKVARALVKRLARSYVVEFVNTGEEGDFKSYVNNYDAIILGLGLPDMSGVDLLRKIRNIYNLSTPVIILTNQDSVETKVDLFDMGADDYMVKPVNFLELEARLRALIRRHTLVPCSTALQLGELSLNLQTKQVFRQDQEIPLRKKEFGILEYLMRNPGKAVTRDNILEHVWDSAYESITNIVDVHMKCLRDQIDKNFEYKMLQTVRGTGYMLQYER